MTNLSVNINKIALLRNSRGANIPDVLDFAKKTEMFGAQGITVHPRPDERHITKADAYALKNVVRTEYNIEGYPTEEFLQMAMEIQPHQCTLVPDSPGQLTSDHGWDTISEQKRLKDIIAQLHSKNIRVSLFIDPVEKMIEAAKDCGTDRIEFYTGPYAHEFYRNKETAILPYVKCTVVCNQLGLGINAGHDLNLDNLRYFKSHVPSLMEVSVGHALVRDCLFYGLENTIQLYLRELES